MVTQTIDDDDILKKVMRYTPLPIILLLILVLLFQTLYIIPAGHRGVLLTFGKPSMVAKEEGIHLKTPLAQTIIKMDVRTLKYEANLTAASKDLQDVNTKIAINYHILPETTPTIYQSIGLDYAEKIIYPYEQEANKGITSQYTAEELITKREEVREKMKNTLAEKLRPRNIIIEEISIIDFQFSQSFTQAIENKVTAEQLKLKADRDLTRIKVEAEQKITSAKAEAESIRIQSEALKSNPDILTLRWIEKWNGVTPLVVTQNTIPLINLPLNTT